MGSGASKSSSGVQFFEGQGEAINRSGVFAPGGLFGRVAGGAPSPGFLSGLNSANETLGRQFAQRGLSGSPLEARALVDLNTNAARLREQDYLDNLFRFMQPAGTQSKSAGASWLDPIGWGMKK